MAHYFQFSKRDPTTQAAKTHVRQGPLSPVGSSLELSHTHCLSLGAGGGVGGRGCELLTHCGAASGKAELLHRLALVSAVSSASRNRN